MLIPRLGILALALALSASLTGCSSQKNANITVDNQSAAPLQVEITMPARGTFGRKPCLEGFVMLVSPGASWESTPDTRRWSMDPNNQQAFRVVAVEPDASPRIIYESVFFDTGKTTCHLIFRGKPGEISCQPVKESGAAAGGEKQLKPRSPE